MIDDEAAEYYDAYLRGYVNGQATVTDVHIRHGGVHHEERVQSYTPGLSNRVIEERYDLPDQRCTQPLMVCVKVVFEEGGEIIFTGAGARIEEVT